MSGRAPHGVDDDETGPVRIGARWRFGAFELNEKRLELRRDGELLKIESKPLNLLMAFLRQPGELITKNDLVSILWPNGVANDAMLGNCVAKLRTALGEDGSTLVKTVFGFGYRFDAEPTVQHDPAGIAAPPKLDFKAGDSPPMRPNWRLIRRLGLSGDSWLVEHTKSRARRVFKFSNDAPGLSALKREVTIYRLLRESLGERVCYVDLLDWNFDVAPWFIEAEYCPSGSLQEWFTAQGGLDKVPFQTRLDLIIQIAEALAAVHAVGVLHKDLKPSNIFVVINDDGRPTIRLADFGSSGLHDTAFLQRLEITRAGFTQMLDADGHAAGTLRYLAPEVAGGQPATIRADIYALGVMLYQFVIGSISHALSTGWEAGIEDEILREDIAASTEGEPERRIADAAELARRLKRLDTRRLEREAEHAARIAAEQASRQRERMKARRAGLITAFVALAIGFVTSAWLYVDARKARDLAESNFERAEAEARRAEKVANFLGQDMFSAVSTDEVPVRDLTVKQLLDAAKLAAEKRFADEPRIAADVYESLGRSYMALEYGEEAVRTLEAALALRESLEGTTANSVLMLAEVLVELLWPLGELPVRLQHFNDMLSAATESRSLGDPFVTRLRVAIARGEIQLGLWRKGQNALVNILKEIDGDPAYSLSYINEIKGSLAYVSMDLKDWNISEGLLNEIITSADPIRGKGNRNIAIARMRLGYVYSAKGQIPEAKKQLQLASEISAIWDRKDGSVPLTIKLYSAWLAIYENKPELAERLLKRIKEEVETLDEMGFNQSFTEDHPLAIAMAMQGKKSDALAIIESAISTAETTLANNLVKSSEHPRIMRLRQVKLAIQDSSIDKILH